MTELQSFRPSHLPGIVALWNRVFAGGPNFIAITEADFVRRVTASLQFERTTLLSAVADDAVAGFVQFGPRLDLYEDMTANRHEWQIYALVAPPSERQLLSGLLGEAMVRISAAGARKVLLYPSWVFGTQAMYNGIAGAYEYPGLSDRREEVIDVARQAGFRLLAEYGTPELDLADPAHLAKLHAEGALLREQARGWGLRERSRVLEPSFFSERWAVTLVRQRRTVAMAAYGPWEEYARQYHRRLFGITSVQVDSGWRGRGLGKLAMIAAVEAAQQAGAEALHLHVYRSNLPAWNLYHRALGFQPKYTWLTLAKDLT
jgi:ribosomal protein S18 acetylase RimI-like enzyme